MPHPKDILFHVDEHTGAISLCFGDTTIKVADDLQTFELLRSHTQVMYYEIKDSYSHLYDENGTVKVKRY